jgi:Ca2+-binding EF-hand superfamily protein
MFCYIKGVCPDEDEIHAKDVFAEFAGEDNTLSQSEFAVIFYLYCQECTKTIDEMFETYDLDKNWQFTLEEFQTLFCEELEICPCPHAGNPTCGAEAYAHLLEFDVTENGELSTVEFSQFYSTHG